ncbi:MAG: NUDIX hydrolase [Pseudonocardiales bacterium]
MGIVISVVVAVVVIASYLTWTAGRLDRLHARVDAAEAALDAQLVRRAVAAEALPRALSAGRTDELRSTARAARATERAGREAAENDLSRVLRQVGLDQDAPEVAELSQAAARVGLARQFYNDAVRDTRAVRFKLLVRVLRMAGHRPMPSYFEIDDTHLASSAAPPD